MIAFVGCLNELIKFIQSKDDAFKVPFKMAEDKVGTYSIQFPKMRGIWSNSDEDWTKSLKCLLTNLKFILSWVAMNQNPFKQKQDDSESEIQSEIESSMHSAFPTSDESDDWKLTQQITEGSKQENNPGVDKKLIN